RDSLGFTLTELMVAVTASLVLTLGLYALYHATLITSVKTLSINATGHSARKALDHIESLLEMGNGSIDDGTLAMLDSSGNKVTSGTSPMPGILFDRYMGGPYLVSMPSAGLLSSTNVVTVTSSLNALPAPPKPQPNDVLIIYPTAVTSGTARLRT